MAGNGLNEVRLLRYTLSRAFLSGVGMEIGAGANPQKLDPGVTCHYFDKHPREFVEHFFGGGRSLPYELHPLGEAGSIFPQGADFLIAHNVLEHCENPIAALMEWFTYVRDGGVCVIGLPLPKYCFQDSRRVVTPFRHVLEDYLFDRTQEDFESREHIYSFRLGWREDKAALGKDAYLDFVLDEGLRQGHDLHWHVGGYEYYHKIILAAGLFRRRRIELLATVSDPEALFVFRLSSTDESMVPAEIAEELSAMSCQLGAASERLAGKVVISTDSGDMWRRLTLREYELGRLRERLHAIENSASWRLTAPLRRSVDLVRHGLRALRRPK